MTSFFAQSFEFFFDKPQSICAFLATTRPIFNSSIIPVTLNLEYLWNSLGRQQQVLEVFLLSHTLQFAASIKFDSTVEENFQIEVLYNLITERRYFSRTIKNFQTTQPVVLKFAADHLPPTSIRTLDFSGSFLWLYDSRRQIQNSDIAPIARFTMLRELHLVFRNHVDDDGMVHLSGLILLEILDLRLTGLKTGKGLEHLKNMKLLRELDLNFASDLEGDWLIHLPVLPSLLKLHFCGVGGTRDAGLITGVAKQQTLRSLNLSSCWHVSATGLQQSASDLHFLEDLAVSSCERTGDEYCHVIASLKGNLKRLTLHNCARITDAGVIEVVSQMKDLEFLDLRECLLLTDQSLMAISTQLMFLRELKISDSKEISSAGIEHLKTLPRLEKLHLGRQSANSQDQNMETLFPSSSSATNMKSLRHLTLFCADSLTDQGLAAVAKSPTLEHLELTHCDNITNAGIASLILSSSLRRVTAMECAKITDECERCFAGTKIHVVQYCQESNRGKMEKDNEDDQDEPLA